jgi:hypothetical protein
MDILVMVDVVANHVGYVDAIKGVEEADGFALAPKVTYTDNFSVIKPFNDAEYYHKMCEI